MKKLILLMFFGLIMKSSFACLNGEMMELTSGDLLFEDTESGYPIGHDFSHLDFDRLYDKIDSFYYATKNIAFLSDKGYLLIIQGNLKTAIELYLEIEKISPGRYATASNIGTAYELNGEDEKALYWIKRAIEIDPTSHHGSEWIHVKILEAKVAKILNPNGSIVLGKELGKMDRFGLEELEKQLYYQLNERVSFIKSKDPVVAVLMFELANINYALNKKTISAEIYKNALKYGYEGTLAKTRIKEIEDREKQQEREAEEALKKAAYYQPVLFFSILLTAFVLLWGIISYVKWVRINNKPLD